SFDCLYCSLWPVYLREGWQVGVSSGVAGELMVCYLVISLGVSIEHSESVAGKDSGELRRLLATLNPGLDDYSKSMILHSIARSVYLLETEAYACTYEDLKLVASFLEDKDDGIKVLAINALKAFTGIWKFKIKIQEWLPKVLDLITSTWNSELHVAGLRLLNGLPLPDYTHMQLKRLMPSLMEILQSGDSLAQVQAVKFFSIMAQKENLLHDILNCQVNPNFLNLFQNLQLENFLSELLFFVEKLSEGCLSPQYRAMHWEYNELSLHEILFGNNSHLADCLICLLMNREEEVQKQACNVILSLQLCMSESSTPRHCRVSTCRQHTQRQKPHPSSTQLNVAF
uniref:Armadillo repeat-containing domain-containing protein n=1 Tax=Sphenodon punctatus TaxID=8508 RepID=A0A8D0H7R0_SPHPU